LILKDGIRPDEVYFVRNGDDLVIYIWERPEMQMMSSRANTVYLIPMELIDDETFAEFREIFDTLTNRITISHFFTNTNHRITCITFDDGTVLTTADILDLVGILPTNELIPHELFPESYEPLERIEPTEPLEY
jgi:hypothetical protein